MDVLTELATGGAPVVLRTATADDVPALVAAGELTDGKTIMGLLAAREHLGLR